MTDSDVLGYISLCDVCGQRAITRTQHSHANPFICPLCAEVAG